MNINDLIDLVNDKGNRPYSKSEHLPIEYAEQIMDIGMEMCYVKIRGSNTEYGPMYVDGALYYKKRFGIVSFRLIHTEELPFP